MFENIEKARLLLKPGSYRAAVDEFFKLINELKKKGNNDEASRLLVEITSNIEKTKDKRLIYQTAEMLVQEIDGFKKKEIRKFYDEVDPFLTLTKDTYRQEDKQFDKAGSIAEAQIDFYKQIGKDAVPVIVEAANDYSKWATRNLGKVRAREEEKKIGNEYIKKAEEMYKLAKQEEKIIETYIKIFEKYIEVNNQNAAEKILDQTVEILLKLKADEVKIVSVTESLMSAFVTFIEFQISDILNPEMQITKLEAVHFDNNSAIRIIQHAKDICINRKAPAAISILAKELALIGLAIFEKGLYDTAIPYYDAAKDYYLEIGNDTETLAFGRDLIILGLQLYTDERTPVGRDFFHIAVDIGQKIDKNFEVTVYLSQAELFLKYNKFQLAVESYKMMIDPLKELPENELRMDSPSNIRQIARERFEKNDFHYAELFYRLVADFFIAFDQIDLAADTYDSVWQDMFSVRQLQTGIDLASKAADAYIKAGKEEEASDVYLKLAEQLLMEGHYDIALERLIKTADTIPDELKEQKFKPLVMLATKYTEQCIKSRDIINARELWKAACDFNESLARSLIKRDVNLVVETIEDHINNVRKFSNDELNEVTMDSAKGSGQVLSEAGENERAAKVMVSFATDFLRKNITQYANPLFEEGAREFIKANQPEEAARILSALARYHSENGNHEKAIQYYKMASIESEMEMNPKILHSIAEHCFETYSSRLNEGAIELSESGYQIAVSIELSIGKESAGNMVSEIAKKFFEIEHYDYSIKYYTSAVEYFLDSSMRYAIVVGAEIIERGREAFQKQSYIESNNFQQLGIDTLAKANQKMQAAQTARIEGERYLGSVVPQLGLGLLNKAINFYQELKDYGSAAEIYVTLARYYISSNELEEGSKQLLEAGKIYIDVKQNNEVKKLVNQITDIATEIVAGKITSSKENESDRAQTSQLFFNVVEEFSSQINDMDLNSQLKYKQWQIYSSEGLHDSAYQSLDRTYESFIQLKKLKLVSQLSLEITTYSLKLIREENLINATKYLNLTIDKLSKVSKYEEAAVICIKTCEEFLKLENNEVAVSWGIRGAEILTEVNIADEAIKFLEELVNQLMAKNSIENAILCYGKIAKILELNGRIKEVEETALKVMAFGTANMKSSNPEAGLRLWEVALTIGSIVGEEFTGRLCSIEGQTFYEIRNYDKSIELFKESFSLFNRAKKQSRLIDLGNTIFTIASDLQKDKDLDTSFKYLPLAFEALISGNELLLATEKMFGNAKNYIELGKDKEGNHIINTAIDTLISKGDMTGGVERCFIGAALFISYGKNIEGSRLIDKGMEKISQITDEAAIKHLATVCRNQGIILRDNDRLEASHIILASGIGILRTINDLVGIGLISIDLGKTLVRRYEMNAAVEAYKNGVHLLAQGGQSKEAADVVNELITEGRMQIDNKNLLVGVPLVELSGDLFISLGFPERIMVISEIFINLGGKMLAERNFDVAALYFSKAMDLATRAGLTDYLPKVGNRCIDFGLKLVKEEDPILGIQFMNAGSDLISKFEKKTEKASRANSNYLEAVAQVLSPAYEKSIEDEEVRLELIGQFVDSTIKFFSQIDAAKALEGLAKILIDYGKKILKTKDPRVIRRILEPALRAAEYAKNTKQQIEIGNAYLDHVTYLSEINKFEYLDTVVNQAVNIYLEVREIKEIRKFMGILAHNARELCLKDLSKSHGIKMLSMLTDLAISLTQPELYPVIIIPLNHLNQQAIELKDYELVIYARQNILRLLQSILSANLPLSILGNISFANMINEWYQASEELGAGTNSFDKAIRIIDQALQLAVLTQEVNIGLAVIDKVNVMIDVFTKKKVKGLEVLYEILAIAYNGLNQRSKVIEIGTKCMNIGKEAAEKKKLRESISFLKTAGRVFAVLEDERLIADVAIASASIGDLRLKDKNYKEGLYYYSAALENYELSQDENSIQLIAGAIQKMFTTAPVEDGYISFLVPGMVYANRDNIKEAEALADKAIKQADKMVKTGKRDAISSSVPYLFAAIDIYERTGNFIEETKIYDTFMFKYIEAVNDPKIVDLFTRILIGSLIKKLRIWDFNAITDLIARIKDPKVLKNKKYQAIKDSINSLKDGEIILALQKARNVNVLYERSIEEFIDNYKEQVKNDINETGKLSIYDYMEKQPVARLINYLIQDLYARKEIEGKYFQIGLFVSSEQLTKLLNLFDNEIVEKGKAHVAEIAQNTALTFDETLSVLRNEYLPQKFQARFNEDYSSIYSYQQLRNEVKDLALGYQEIGNIDINKISQQLKFQPETIQREIEYLILEGMINPRLVGRT